MHVSGRRSLFLSPLWGAFTSPKASSVYVFGKHVRTKLYDQLLHCNQDLIQQLVLYLLCHMLFLFQGLNELSACLSKDASGVWVLTTE